MFSEMIRRSICFFICSSEKLLGFKPEDYLIVLH
jgi:hypothetical protein